MYPYDYMVVIYGTFMCAICFLFGRPVSDYTREIAFYAGVVILALLIARHVDEKRSRIHAFIRLLYPAMLFPMFYRMMAKFNFVFFDEFLDWQLTTFEKMIFGVNPTLYIDQHLLTVWLNELISLGYFSYYFMVGGMLFTLYWFKHHDRIKRVVSALCLTFFISYLLFMLYPIEGPRWYFADQYVNTIDGPVFREAVKMVIAGGAFHGGCMPSSHVAVAMIVLFACFKYYPRFALYVLLPLNILLAIGTFWGRYHYVSDVVVGAAIAIFADRLLARYYDRWIPEAYNVRIPTKLTREHAS
jgi:membrane-associated phospholipid phosphatase